MTGSEGLGPPRQTKLTRYLLPALLLLFLGRVVATYPVFSNTTDEPAHVAAGVEYWQYGVYDFEAQHPPLARAAIGLLPYMVAGLRLEPPISMMSHYAWGGHDRTYYWVTLSLARAGNLLFAALLFWVVYRWSALLYGRRAALAACFLLICCPNILAHSGLATLDIGAAATTVLAAFCFWQWSQNPGWRWCLASAVCFSLAVLTKFSAIGFLPPLAVGAFVIGRWKLWTSAGWPSGPELRDAVLKAATFVLVLGGLIWAVYRFHSGRLVDPGHHYFSQFTMGHPPQGLPKLLIRAVGTRSLPAHRFWQGVIDVLSHNEHGHRAYLLGKLSLDGWWYYFLVAVLVKSTIPMLLLVALALGVYALHPRPRPPGTAFLILAIVVVFAVTLYGRINIGVRHVLHVYPIFAILASSLFSEQVRSWRLKTAALLLLAAHAVESYRAHPDYLPYFNQVAHGREERVLADSNLDWGQDLARLSRYLRENNIGKFQLSYFGAGNPGLLGVEHDNRYPCCRPEPGWIAVSVNHLVGIGDDAEQVRWLRGHHPDIYIGKSIWLFHIR